MPGVRGLLCALEAFKALSPDVTISQVIAFLYVSGHDGLSVQDLARLAGFTQSTASRSLRAIGVPGTGWAQRPALGLVEAFLCPTDGRTHRIWLSSTGREMRDRLDRLARTAGQSGARRAPRGFA